MILFTFDSFANYLLCIPSSIHCIASKKNIQARAWEMTKREPWINRSESNRRKKRIRTQKLKQTDSQRIHFAHNLWFLWMKTKWKKRIMYFNVERDVMLVFLWNALFHCCFCTNVLLRNLMKMKSSCTQPWHEFQDDNFRLMLDKTKRIPRTSIHPFVCSDSIAEHTHSQCEKCRGEKLTEHK